MSERDELKDILGTHTSLTTDGLDVVADRILQAGFHKTLVSREEIGNAIADAEHDNEDGSQSLRSVVSSVYALQLPKPQTVGRVDLSGAIEALEHVKNDLLDIHEEKALHMPRPVMARRAIESLNRALAHLQAPAESEVKP